MEFMATLTVLLQMGSEITRLVLNSAKRLISITKITEILMLTKNRMLKKSCRSPALRSWSMSTTLLLVIQLDENADLAFFGWITATYSFGQMLACWVFGYWNQKTMSTIKPACCGLVLMAIGNFVYGILPTLPSNYRWYMLAARFVAGIGSGWCYLLFVVWEIPYERLNTVRCFLLLRRVHAKNSILS